MVVGASANSQHLLGEAVDSHIKGITFEDSFDWHESRIPFWQLIDERRGGGRWLHASMGGRREMLVFRNWE